MAKDEGSARALIPGICTAIQNRVHLMPDQRSREVISEAILWSRDHPEALDIYSSGRQAKNGHMPNMVAFSNLLEGLESFSKKWKRPLKTLVHDRQSQFEQTLEEWHRMYSTAPDTEIELPGETYIFQKVVGSSFEMSSSDDSPGIQIADVILWLFRKYLADKPLGIESLKLLQLVFKRGWQSDFSFKGVGRTVSHLHETMMANELSEEQIDKGKELQKRFEENRQRAISQYEEDGLMPYQRNDSTTLSDSTGE